MKRHISHLLSDFSHGESGIIMRTGTSASAPRRGWKEAAVVESNTLENETIDMEGEEIVEQNIDYKKQYEEAASLNHILKLKVNYLTAQCDELMQSQQKVTTGLRKLQENFQQWCDDVSEDENENYGCGKEVYEHPPPSPVLGLSKQTSTADAVAPVSPSRDEECYSAVVTANSLDNTAHCAADTPISAYDGLRE